MGKSPFNEIKKMKSEPFSKPLDTFIEEDIAVKKVKFNPETKKTFTTYELEKVRTKYMDIPYEKYRCVDGEHVFKCIDPHKWIFSCINCSYFRKVYPVTYNFEDGKLIHRKTGKVV